MIPSPAAALTQAHRLFFALLPPPDVAATIGEQRQAFGITRSVVADHRLHITLAISPDHAAGLLDALIAAGIRAGESIASLPFRIVLDQAAGSSGSIALRPSEPLAALIAFQRALAASIDQAGFEQREGWRFNPHVTLGYRKGAPFTEQILPISWQATDFVLIHSHIGLTRHGIVARWSLPQA